MDMVMRRAESPLSANRLSRLERLLAATEGEDPAGAVMDVGTEVARFAAAGFGGALVPGAA